MNRLVDRLILVLAIATLPLSLTGCLAEQSPRDTVTESVYKNNFEALPLGIGVLTDEQGQLGALKQVATKVAQDVENQLGVNTLSLDVAETATPEDALVYLSDQGLRLIYLLGAQEQVAKVAPRYPNITYVCVGFEGPKLKNVQSIRYRLEEAAYLGGVLAATLSKTNQVGFIAGTENEQTVKEYKAFAQGVEFVVKQEERDIAVTKAYIDVTDAGFHKLDKAEAKTLELIDKGADFIYSDSGQANKGVIMALAQRQATGTVVASERVVHDKIINTFVLSIERSMFATARAYVTKQDHKAIPALGLKEKGIEISAFNEDRALFHENIIYRLAYIRDELVAKRIKL